MQNSNNNNLGNNPKNTEALLFTVDGKEYKWDEQYITGEQLRTLAAAPNESLESKLYLAIIRPWEDELIDSIKLVNLARPEIEHFYFKNILLLMVNGKEYSWSKEYITGAEIKTLASISAGDELLLSIRKPWEDELILNTTQVNLARPGIESFYSRKAITYSFFIDKKEYTTPCKELTVRQILVDFANVSPETNVLAEKHGSGFNEFKNLDESLNLAHIRRFVIFNNTATSVS